MALNVNNPDVHRNSLSLISSDSCTSENSRTNSVWRGEWYSVQARYIIHMYCLVVQTGCFKDVVVCETLDRRVSGLIFGQGMKFFKSP